MAASGLRSKKRSDANSTSKPPEPFIIYIDRSLGKKTIAAALREAGVEVHVHDDFFPQDAWDAEWLQLVGQRRWVAVTQDQKIRYRGPELAALIKARVRAFVLTGGDLKGDEVARILVKALPAMKRLTTKYPPPFIGKITKSGAVSILQLAE